MCSSFASFRGLPLESCDAILSKFIQFAYDRGTSLGDASETLNAIVDQRPALKGNLRGSWSSLRVWKDLQPALNHVPTPVSLFLALISLSLLWNWINIAFLTACMFLGMLRPGEALKLTAADIIFPDSTLLGICTVFLRISSPKMRRLNARREFVKIDDPLFFRLARLIKEWYAPDRKVWPDSYANFVLAHRALLRYFRIPSTDGIGITPASHRTGAATFYFLAGVPLDYIRWHGRWQSGRTLEIYIQEASASTFFDRLIEFEKEKMLTLSTCTGPLLDMVTDGSLGSAPRVPHITWG